MTTTDPIVPWIRSGTGETPAQGGCVMQIADWIYRNEWTDSPPCVHPVFRTLAIKANDTLPDDERQKLLDLIPRMMDTNTDDEVLSRKLAGWCARQVYPIYAEWKQRTGYDDKGSVLACVEAAERGESARTDAARAAANAAYANAAAADAAYAATYATYAAAADAADAATYATYAAYAYSLLCGALDHYDQLTNRPAPKPVDLSPVAAICANKENA